MPELLTRIDRIEVLAEATEPTVIDHSGWDWYADTCACGLAPGECRVHPRAAEPAAAAR